MKFYETKEFKELQAKWREKLEKSGFEDQENEKEKLKTYDRRTQSWESRHTILEFQLQLERYLQLFADQIQAPQRNAIILYSQGKRIKAIAEEVGKDRFWVMYLISKYKKIVSTFSTLIEPAISSEGQLAMSPAAYKIRKATGNDLNFIYDTFIKSYKFDSWLGKSMRTANFSKDYREVIDYILARPNSATLVSCQGDNPNIIFGYGIFEPGIIHYLFVKEAFRRFGIAKSLVYASCVAGIPHQHQPLTYTHQTFTAKRIIKEHSYPLIHQPTLLFHKGIENGQARKNAS